MESKRVFFVAPLLLCFLDLFPTNMSWDNDFLLPDCRVLKMGVFKGRG